MNKRIVVSGMSIVAALVMMGGAAFAVFTDQASSTGNTFSSGNADLQIAVNVDGPGGELFGESISGPTFTGLFPGEVRQFDFWLKNSSTSAIDLDLTADVTNIVDPVDANDLIDNTLLISWVCDTDGNGGLADNTPTSEFSPRDWFVGGNAGLGILDPGEEMICRMFGELPSGADETVASETVSFDVIYDATQVVAP